MLVQRFLSLYYDAHTVLNKNWRCAGKPYDLGWRVSAEERQGCAGSPGCTGESLLYHTLKLPNKLNKTYYIQMLGWLFMCLTKIQILIRLLANVFLCLYALKIIVIWMYPVVFSGGVQTTEKVQEAEECRRAARWGIQGSLHSFGIWQVWFHITCHIRIVCLCKFGNKTWSGKINWNQRLCSGQ